MDENTRKSATPQPCRFELFNGDSLFADWCPRHASFQANGEAVCNIVMASAVDTAVAAEPCTFPSDGPGGICGCAPDDQMAHIPEVVIDAGVNPEPSDGEGK